MVCIYALDTKLFYFSKELLDEIEDEIIYVNVEDASLLNEDEWPWYIKNAGFTYMVVVKTPFFFFK